MSAFAYAAERYAELGVEVESAIARALAVPISIHCWQSDDVRGFEVKDNAFGGGIMATGNFPGAATCPAEVKADLAKVLRLVPGVHRVNLHASYAETDGQRVDRDALGPEHFLGWLEWAAEEEVKLDFNPTYFAHTKADSGYTLSHADPDIRAFWVRHGIASRRIAAALALRQGADCINNHWCPDGEKDSPADRWSPRRRLAESLDQILAEPMPGCVDAVESKLFGLGSEDYVVGSFEFYTAFAQLRNVLYCLDMGHFHPTESIADKVSALLLFHERILLHTSRPIRWDSDHVVLFDDSVRALFLELVRGKALERVVVALDFFDASINRIAAYVIGIRATRKGILYALLDPTELLQQAENVGDRARKLALMEEAKTLPFGEVWDELCRRAEVPAGGHWLAEVDAYAKTVLASRA
jgi:L-rhamnose isomerase